MTHGGLPMITVWCALDCRLAVSSALIARLGLAACPGWVIVACKKPHECERAISRSAAGAVGTPTRLA